MKRPIVFSLTAMLAFQSSVAFAQDAAKKKDNVAYFLDEAESVESLLEMFLAE